MPDINTRISPISVEEALRQQVEVIMPVLWDVFEQRFRESGKLVNRDQRMYRSRLAFDLTELRPETAGARPKGLGRFEVEMIMSPTGPLWVGVVNRKRLSDDLDEVGDYQLAQDSRHMADILCELGRGFLAHKTGEMGDDDPRPLRLQITPETPLGVRGYGVRSRTGDLERFETDAEHSNRLEREADQAPGLGR